MVAKRLTGSILDNGPVGAAEEVAMVGEVVAEIVAEIVVSIRAKSPTSTSAIHCAPRARTKNHRLRREPYDSAIISFFESR